MADYVFEIYRADLTLAFNQNTKVTKYIATRRIPFNETASIVVPEWATSQPYIAVVPLDANSGYQPVFTRSGTTLSWQPFNDARITAYTGSPRDVDLIYGYY